MATFAQIQEEIGNMLDIPEEELTEEQKAEMDAYLDMLGNQEAEKVDGFAQFIKLESARAEALKEEGRRLSSKAKTAENRIAWLKNRYLTIMQNNGLKKVKGDLYSLSVRATPTVIITNENAIPDDGIYIKTKIERTPDKIAIKEGLKGGLEIPGCELGTSYSLQVR